MRLQRLGPWIVVVALGVVAACSGGGGGGGGDDDDDDDGTGDMAVPVTVTMTQPIGGTSTVARICQTLVIGGGIGYGLEPGLDCVGGENYLVFARDANGVYGVIAGVILDPKFNDVPVEILTTSVGSVSQEPGSGSDQVVGLSSGGNITIGTIDHPTVTFSFLANDITVTDFE